MEPISNAVHMPATLMNVEKPSNELSQKDVWQPENNTQNSPQKPRMDEYIPEKKQDTDNRHSMNSNADDSEKKISSGKAKKCTVNTDKVDREIEKLKKKQTELKQQIHSETDASKAERLERELARIEQELQQKDNDAYRRRHAAYTYS